MTPPTQSPPAARRDRGLLAIAVFKFTKFALLTAAGFGALQMLRPEVADAAQAWAADLAIENQRQVLQYALEQAGQMSDARLKALTIASFCYAVLFLVEGVGLLMQRRWAEYLTVIAGASLIPIEFYELSRHVGPVKIAILIINVIIVWYLVIRLRAESLERRARKSEVSRL
jgi:uncharacterized membrane protein (DUF2068 family)